MKDLTNFTDFVNELRDPWTGQEEIFGAPEQYDMTKAQKDAYEAWQTAIDKKYKGRGLQLYVDPKQGVPMEKGYLHFDLKGKHAKNWHYIDINAKGHVKVPIGFYRADYDKTPDWVRKGGGGILTNRPITKKDVKEIIAGLDKTP